MTHKEAEYIIDRCMCIRQEIYSKGERVPAPIHPLHDFGIESKIKGELTRNQVINLLVESGIDKPKTFRGHEI